ncbi:MAG: CoA transferase [Burkholderiaceae bacterium]|nr:CoA transferase [Burkholderiaceae bacterium]
MTPHEALASIWRLAGLPEEALGLVTFTGSEPVFPSSFAVGTAAQSTIAAAALAACELGYQRGVPRQAVSVDMLHAAAECTGWFSLDGVAPEPWDKFSGLYRAADGWVRVHANFAHHRDGALRLLGLDPSTATPADAQAAMLGRSALAFEEAAGKAGLVAFALRSFDEWDATPQAHALAKQPLLTIERIGDAPPLPLPPLAIRARPLDGVRVLDLTRILAGPVAGRALASFGADVMLVNSPLLANIAAIADTSRGKRSVHVDLKTSHGQGAFSELVRGTQVMLQGYRPGGLEGLGFGAQAVAAQRPGIVYVSLSAFGPRGPWAARRGFDSLLQTAMGFNHAEGEAAGDGQPRALPMQILDEASGYLMAMGASTALGRQQREGGSWHVQVSLAQTAVWLRSLGRVAGGLQQARPAISSFIETSSSGFGELAGIRPSAQLARTPVGYQRPSERPGTSLPVW